MDEATVKIVSKVCNSFESCIYAVIFGSRAVGRERPFSDVDVAVMLDCEPDDALDIAAEIAQRLEGELRASVDVIPLNIADTVLKYEVFSNGVLAFCRDRDRFADDRLNAIDEFLDFKPLFDKFYRRVREEIKRASARSKS